MRVGYESTSGMYYEVLGEPSDKTPILFIHGGGATGACFRHDLHGGPGWADRLAERGHEVWVTDWPGCGRSGGRDIVDIVYADVVDAYRTLLRETVARPAVIVPHSMGGSTTWQLVEHESELVAGVVTIAAAFPGNLSSGGRVLFDDGNVVRLRLDSTGAEFLIDRRRGYLYEDDYIVKQAIATSTRFPTDHVDRFRAGMVPIPPLMVLQRTGVLEGLPPVRDPNGFVGKQIRMMAGPEDPMHTHAIESATVELLRGWGADAHMCWLEDRGIQGNGHFLFWEDNQEQLLDVLEEQILAVSS